MSFVFELLLEFTHPQFRFPTTSGFPFYRRGQQPPSTIVFCEA